MTETYFLPKFALPLAALAFAFCGIAAPQGPPTPQKPAPSSEEQEKLISVMRQYAEDYTGKLPNFICEQVTSQFEAGRKPTHWHQGDTLTSKLILNQGHEERSLVLVNDKPIQRDSRRWRTPLTTEGEFGILLANIFDPVTETKFSWNRWDNLRGHEVAVFDFAVDKAHSTLSLSLSDLAKAVLPYGGSVYAEPETGAVLRIVSETLDIPPQIRTKSIATTVDYDQVEIAGQRYLLPVTAVVALVTDANHVRNQMEYRAYRKFEAESTITFQPPAGTNPKEKPHLP